MKFCRENSIKSLVPSHLEVIVTMLYLSNNLENFFEYDLKQSLPLNEINIPSGVQIKYLISSFQKFGLMYDHLLIRDTILFYYQVEKSKDLSEEEIAENPWEDNTSNIPSSFFYNPSMNDERISDRFGLINMNSKNMNHLTRQFYAKDLAFCPCFDELKTNEFFDPTVEEFMSFKQNYIEMKNQRKDEIQEEIEKLNAKKEIFTAQMLDKRIKMAKIQESPDIKRIHNIISNLNAEVESIDLSLSELPADFKKNEFKFTDDDHLEILKYISYLKTASKAELEMRGYNPDQIIFKDRPQMAIDNLQVSTSENEPLFKMYDEFLKNELTLRKREEYISSHSINFADPVHEIFPDEVEGLLQKNDDYAELKRRLRIIDHHAYSAKSISERTSNKKFVYGNERAKYPENLVEAIIKGDHENLFKDLMTHHEPGMKSVFNSSQEKIFLAAFKSKLRRNKDKYIVNLAQAQFPFTQNQKKALFARILENDDDKLCDSLVVKTSTINMFEYMEDRGITFFQWMLIEGREISKNTNAPKHKVINLFRNKVMIKNPSQKILYVPIPLPEMNEDLAVDPDVYWRPHQNNFPKAKGNDIVFKKNWDNLTIAAAMKDMEIFSTLLSFDLGVGVCDTLDFALKNRNDFVLACRNHSSNT